MHNNWLHFIINKSKEHQGTIDQCTVTTKKANEESSEKEIKKLTLQTHSHKKVEKERRLQLHKTRRD